MKILPYILILTLLWGCGTTEELPEEEPEDDDAEEELRRPSEADPTIDIVDPDFEFEDPEDIRTSIIDIDLRSYRSSLRDHYTHVQLTVPEVYLEEEEEDQRRISNSGFRVQIASTRDMSEAEEFESRFNSWVETMNFNVEPNSYISFRQPNYRVHVGDFLNRSEAIAFSQIVRQEFEGAWVVRDQINRSALLQTLEEEEQLQRDDIIREMEEQEEEESEETETEQETEDEEPPEEDP